MVPVGSKVVLVDFCDLNMVDFDVIRGNGLVTLVLCVIGLLDPYKDYLYALW